jgi:hypothetical protein
MIPKECKRLAEVDFPIAVVSKHSAREKSIRHRQPFFYAGGMPSEALSMLVYDGAYEEVCRCVSVFVIF